MAKLMVIAGGDWQCPIVKKAKELGHFVICSNLYEDSPAFEFSDIRVVADVLDKEKNLQIAEKYSPDAVLTDQSDIAVPTVAYISEKLGLKGIGSDKAELFTNKYKMREFCKQYGFAHPDYRLCTSLKDAEEFLEEYGKAVMKPLDSQSSRGVYLVSRGQNLEGKFASAVHYSNVQKAALMEQYINGTEFTADGIKTREGYWTTAVSKKDHYKHNINIAKELLFSNYDEIFDYDALREINERMVLQMGLPFGLTHAEYKFMDGKFYLIEIAARGGGTKISSDIAPLMSGIDVNKVFINELLGIYTNVNIDRDKNNYAILGFFDFEPGMAGRIKGLDEIAKCQGVVEVSLNFQEGDWIHAPEDDRSRQGYYILHVDTYDKLRNLEKKVKETVQIVYGG